MRYLITGGAGFTGSNLGAEVLDRGDELFVFDNLSRLGSSDNLEWLKSIHQFSFYPFDIRNSDDIENVIREINPHVIFHLAGQVAMTTSISNPRLDFEINTIGTYNLLEAVRKYSPNSMIIYSSTNKVYGDFKGLTFKEKSTRFECLEKPFGFNEDTPLDFHSPYGCSKGAADQYLIDYNRIYGIKTVVFRHSTMYGGRQYATIDQGWIGWFCEKAKNIKNNIPQKDITIAGNGKQVRDVLHIDDIKNLYFRVVEKIDEVSGQVFNIGGGFENSLSLLELFSFLEEELNIQINFTKLVKRKSDQKVFIADISKAKRLLGWYPRISKDEGIKKMMDWTLEIERK